MIIRLKILELCANVLSPRAMVTPAAQSSVLSSSTVLNAVNDSDSEELSDQDTNSDVEHSGMVVREQGLAQDETTSTDDLALTGCETSSSTSAISLLSVLRPPRPSDPTRKRKLQCNPGKRKNKTSSSIDSEPKGIKPQDRVRKYPYDCLSVSHGKLFCSA